ncbi:hypothetical protein AB6A23_20775 [Paenibacillus tarimensis]
MDFEDIMATFVGRSIEVFQTGQILTGTLQGVTEGTLQTIVSPSIYSPVSGAVSVSTLSISFVRVLP